MKQAALVLFLVACHASSGGAGAASDAAPAEANPVPARVLAMDLPAARAGRSVPFGTPVIWVDGERVLQDGSQVGTTGGVLQAGRPQRIDGLMDSLRRTRDAAGSFDGVVALGFDAAAPGDVVKSVLQTAAFAGYRNALLIARGANGEARALDVQAIVPLPNPPPPLSTGLRVFARPNAWTLLRGEALGQSSSRTAVASLADLGDALRSESDSGRGRAVLLVSHDVDYGGIVAVVDTLLPVVDVTLSLVPEPPSVIAGDLVAVTDVGASRLPPGTIQKLVRQNLGGLRFCYQQGLARNPSLSGTVRMRFVIARDGSVARASADPGSTLPDAAVVACLQERFRRIQFPTPEGGRVEVVYPMTFALPDDAAQ